MYTAKTKKWALNHIINSREETRKREKFWERKITDPFERIFFLAFGTIKVAAFARVRYSGPCQTEIHFYALSGGFEDSDFMWNGFTHYMLGHQKMPTFKQVKEFFISEAKAAGLVLEKSESARQTTIFEFVS